MPYFFGEFTLAYADLIAERFVFAKADLFGLQRTELYILLGALLFANADTLLAHFFGVVFVASGVVFVASVVSSVASVVSVVEPVVAKT
jgi:hypothetical protein